jgi:outer membrane immunogenic protein
MLRNRIPVMTAGLLAFGGLFSTPSTAADLWGQERYGSIKDAPIVPVFTWTGFYAGVDVGLATGDTNEQVKVDDDPLLEALLRTGFDVNGPIYGGHVGYNYQSGSWVVGIEGTFSGTDIDGDSPCVFVLSCSADVDWIGTVEGRIGYGFGRSLIYARGGVAWGDVSTRAIFLDPSIFNVRSDETHTGWTAGLGFEYAISDFVIARIEYSHIDLGSETHTLDASFDGDPIGSVPASVDMEIDTVKVGVSVKFNGGKFGY